MASDAAQRPGAKTKRVRKLKPVSDTRDTATTRHKRAAARKPAAPSFTRPIGDETKALAEPTTKKARRAVKALPADSRTKVFPTLESYTPAQRKTIVREQSKALDLGEKVGGVDVAISGRKVPRRYAEGDERTRKAIRQVVKIVKGETERKQAKAYTKFTGEKSGSVRARARKLASLQTPDVAYPHKDKRAGIGGLATINVSAVGDIAHKASERVFAGQAGPRDFIYHGLPGITKNAAKDAVNIPAQIIPSMYRLGSLAAQGRFKEVGRDLVQPYKDVAKNPLQSLYEHPLGTALLAAGPKAVVDRGAGAIVPAGKRAPAVVEGTTIKAGRAYSPALTTRMAQKVSDKSKAKKVGKLTAEAKSVEKTNPSRARELHQKAARIDPTRASGREVRRRVDERVDVNEGVRRIHRAKTTDEVRKVVGKRPSPLIPLVAQRVVKPDRADIEAYVSDLKAQHDRGGLSNAEKVANRTLRAHVEGALKDRKLDLDDVSKKADAYRDLTKPLEDKVVGAGLLERGQVDRAKLMPYAVRRMGARHDPEKGLMVGEGKKVRKLSDDEIRSHMKRTGTPEPAFLTQAPNMRGAKNFYVASHRPPSASSPHRTGEATRKGTFDVHPDTLTEHAARARGLVDAHEGFQGLVGEFAHRSGSGKVRVFQTRKQADQAIREVSAVSPQAHGLRAVRVQPFAGKAEQTRNLLDVEAHPEGAKSVLDAIDHAVKGEDGPGPWALIPETAAKQLEQHVKVLGASPGGKGLQAVNQMFRQTVLATSPKWLTGNVVEAAGRTALMRAGPRSYVTGRKTLKRLEKIDPKAAEATSVRAVGGGHFQFAERSKVHRDASQFDPEGTGAQAVRALGAVGRAPGPKQVANAWKHYTHWMFTTVNGKLESQFQTAMAGKHIRENLIDPGVMKTGSKAVEQAAQGLRNTNEQVAMARAVDRAYGKYSKFSPKGRQFLALYTPFIAWSLNAAKFVFSVLPKDHPVATSLMASSVAATEEWRKEHGLDKFIEGAVPGWLQGSIPTKEGGHLRFQYTPFGAFSDPGDTAASSVLPQWRGTLSALQGKDWKGRELKFNGKPLDDTMKPVFALKALGEATIPLVGQGERFARAEGGALKKARKVYDPFMPIPPKEPSGSTTTSGTLPTKVVKRIARSQARATLSPEVLRRLAKAAR